MMKTKVIIGMMVAAAAMLLASCTDDPKLYSANENFDMLWRTVDEHYCFFEYKNIDWNEVGNRYRAKMKEKDSMTQIEFFDLLAEMLAELQDGHVNLSSSFDTSRYWIWEQYPVNYDERLIDEHYLHFTYRLTGGMKYAQLQDSTFGYIYYGDFASGMGEGNIHNVLKSMDKTKGLIIDVRSNGGGYLTNVETFVRRFLDERTYAGAIRHKTGPGHNDFSEPYPYPYYFEPSNGYRYLDRPIVVLANRGSFSATNNFVSIMKSLPNVTVIGDTTGGGCGLPFTSEIPIGWNVRFSAAPIIGPDGELTEWGVAPDIKVDMDAADAAAGHDTILDAALDFLNSQLGKRADK